MDRETFRRRFAEAAASARDFARDFVVEPLPDALRFRLRLNSSYDGNPLRNDQVVFPDDSSLERAMALNDVGFEEAVSTLWREGRVPEWVDLQVASETGAATLIDATVCGRFTSNDERLYHQEEGYPPFSVKSPRLPPGHGPGGTFSIYTHSECWGPADFERTVAYAPKVRSLSLVGPYFDDSRLSRLPPFVSLEVLELRQVSVQGPGLSGLAETFKLLHLSASFAPAAALSLEALPGLPHLRSLELEWLPAELRGVSRLAACAPFLRSLTLSPEGPLDLDVPSLDLPELDSFRFRGPELPPSFELRTNSLRSLGLCGERIGDGDVLRLASPHPKLESLDLDRTQVSDRLFAALGTWPELEYLSVVGTQVSAEGLQRLAQRYPQLRVYPRLD